MKKPGTYIDNHVKPYLCTKFGDSSLKNEFRNAKTGWLIKWSIMRIFKGPVTLPKIRVNVWITHKIWLCVLVRREFDHFCWLTWWKITDELRKNYGKITHKSLTNHALQRIGTKRTQTGRMRGCAWRIRDGKQRIISALSLVNCVWIAHDSRMNCAKNAQEALKLRSFRAFTTDAAPMPWNSRFNSRRQHIVSSSSSSSPFSSVSGSPKILTITIREY